MTQNCEDNFSAETYRENVKLFVPLVPWLSSAIAVAATSVCQIALCLVGTISVINYRFHPLCIFMFYLPSGRKGPLVSGIQSSNPEPETPFASFSIVVQRCQNEAPSAS